MLKVIDWMAAKMVPTKTKRPKRALIIEDTLSDAELLESFLTKCDITFDTAHTAEAAEAFIQKNGYDLAFVDMRLTHMSGWRLMQVIDAYSPHTHLIVTCGSIQDLAQIDESLSYSVLPKRFLSVERIKKLLAHLKD